MEKQRQGVLEAKAAKRQAQKEMQAAEIMLASSLRENYSMIRSAEQLMKLYQEGLIPKARQDIQLSLSGYMTGKVEAITAISRLKALLDIELLYWSQLVEREKAIARPEAIAGVTEFQAEGKNSEKIKVRSDRLHYSVGLWLSPPLTLPKPISTGPASEKIARPVQTRTGRPKKEAVQARLPTVEIPTDKQQLIGLKTTAGGHKSLTKDYRTVGRIENDERKMATVNTKFEGWIEKLHIDYTGR